MLLPIKYRIEIIGDGQTIVHEKDADQGGSLATVIRSLRNGITYLVKIFSVNNNQGVSAASETISVIPQPAPQSAKSWAKDLLPVLLLHGYQSDSSVWKSLLEQFKDVGGSFYAYDFTSVNQNVCEQAEELKQFISVVRNKTGASKVILVGHSQGGLVARTYMQFGAKPQEFTSKLYPPGNSRVLTDEENACYLIFSGGSVPNLLFRL